PSTTRGGDRRRRDRAPHCAAPSGLSSAGGRSLAARCFASTHVLETGIPARRRIMDLTYSPEDRAFREKARRWLEANVPTDDLKKMLTAEEIWCQLYSEPNAGSDLASLKTRAEDRGDHFLVNGQKIWTSSGPIADWGILLARTDSKAPKHKGISCFLLNMRQPGVEVRPLKQITGSSLFSEVFMTDARAERRHLIGTLNQGWEIAQTTLGFERGSNSLGRVTRYAIAFNQLVRAAKELRRDGRPLIEDPRVRAKLGKIYAELEVQRYAGLRVLSALNRGESPGAASSITKLSYTEFEKRYYELALEILGPWGQLVTAREEFEEIDTSSGEPGTWATAFLWSRAGTIYSGSSEIQKNIIGERVLGLPKEVRADRLKA